MENILKISEEKIIFNGFDDLPAKFTIAFLPHTISIYPEWKKESLVYPWHFTLEREGNETILTDPIIFARFKEIILENEKDDVKELEADFMRINGDDNRDTYILRPLPHNVEKFLK